MTDKLLVCSEVPYTRGQWDDGNCVRAYLWVWLLAIHYLINYFLFAWMYQSYIPDWMSVWHPQYHVPLLDSVAGGGHGWYKNMTKNKSNLDGNLKNVHPKRVDNEVSGSSFSAKEPCLVNKQVVRSQKWFLLTGQGSLWLVHLTKGLEEVITFCNSEEIEVLVGEPRHVTKQKWVIVGEVFAISLS